MSDSQPSCTKTVIELNMDPKINANVVAPDVVNRNNIICV